MAGPGQKRVKLAGVLEGTVTSAQIRADGSLVVELYDFSQMAQDHFGNDVAFLLIVSAPNKGKVLSILKAERAERGFAADPDRLLLQLLKEHFSGYYAVKEWFDENGIVYEKAFDSWA